MSRITGTPRQEQALAFIRSHIAERGHCPSYGEIAEHIGVRSRSNVNRLMVGLEDRGLIRRQPRRARCIQIVSPARAALMTVLDEFKWSPECRAEMLARLEGAQ